MKILDDLRTDHRQIRRVLDAFDVFAAKTAETSRLDLGAAARFREFLTVFADGIHHTMEEDHLFPALGSMGLPSHYGPIAVMLEEHKQGRGLIAEMRQAAEDYADGSPEAATRYARSTRQYIELLRAHISKEDNILFPLAEVVVAKAEMPVIPEPTESAEDKSERERCLRLAEELCAEFGQEGRAPARASAK